MKDQIEIGAVSRIYDPKEYLEELLAGKPAVQDAVIVAQSEWFPTGDIQKPFGMYEWFEDYFSRLPVAQMVIRSIVHDIGAGAFYTIQAHRVFDPITRVGRHAGMPQTVKISAQVRHDRFADINRDHVRITSSKGPVVAVYRRVLDANGEVEWFTEVEVIHVDRHREFKERTPSELVTAIQSMANQCEALHCVNNFKDGPNGNGRWDLITYLKGTTKLTRLLDFVQYGTTGATKLGALKRRLSQKNTFTTPVAFHKHYQSFLQAIRAFEQEHVFVRMATDQHMQQAANNPRAFLDAHGKAYLEYLAKVEAFYETWLGGTEAVIGTILMFNEE